MADVKRRYDASRRRAGADATRARIAAAARRLFVKRGFAATTVDQIAESARVSVPTVYATFGSKRAILVALLDHMEADAESERYGERRAAARTPREQLEVETEFHLKLFGRGAELVAAVRAAGPTDAEFDALRVEGERRRRAALRPIVVGWRRAGVLRDDLTDGEAEDILFTFYGDEFYRSFAIDHRWPIARFGPWLTESLVRLLFADGGGD